MSALNDERPTPATVQIDDLRTAPTVRRPRPRAPFTVQVTDAKRVAPPVGLLGHAVVYRVIVTHDEGEFVEVCPTADAVGKYLRGLDAGTFPAEIEWPKGWEHYR